MENEKKYHAEAETPTNLPNDDDESEEDADDENLREDVRFILQNDIDYVIQSVYKSHQEL